MKLVNLRLMSLNRVVMNDKDSREDVGTGYIITTVYNPDVETDQHQIAVVSGCFDGHRNDLGELWVNDSEIER